MQNDQDNLGPEKGIALALGMAISGIIWIVIYLLIKGAF
jgi:hypothetical protein